MISMKKIIVVFLVFIFLFLGIMIGSTSSNIDNEKLSEELKDFEGKIVLPDNNYQGRETIEVEPNIFGKTGKKVESVIDNVFDLAKGIIKKIID